MKTNCSSRRNRALTLVEVLAVIVVFVLLVILLLPALSRAREKAQMITCNGHLKLINLAFKIWENDQTKLYPMSVSTNYGGTLEYVSTDEIFRHFQVISNELVAPVILVCPADVRRPAKDFRLTLGNTNISYFIGTDVVEPKPPDYLFASMFVSGDDNFEISGVPVKSGMLRLSINTPIAWTAARHNRQGNIALADGSVEELSNSGLTNLLSQTGITTNRLAIP